MPTVKVKGRRYAGVPVSDLRVADKVISAEGHLYVVMGYEDGNLIVQGQNGAEYRWRRKPTTTVGIPFDTLTCRSEQRVVATKAAELRDQCRECPWRDMEAMVRDFPEVVAHAALNPDGFVCHKRCGPCPGPLRAEVETWRP